MHNDDDAAPPSTVDLHVPELDDSERTAAQLVVWALARELPERGWAVTDRTGRIVASSTGFIAGRGTTALAAVELESVDSWLTIVSDAPVEPTAAAAIAARAVGVLVQAVIGSDRRARVAETAATEAWAQAHLDPVTHVQNARGWWERVSDLQAAHDDEGAFVIARVVLEDLRRVNDERGHLHGDLVLRVVAEHLVASLPSSALVARLDAGDFAVLVEGMDSVELERRIQRALIVDGIGVRLGIARHEPGEPIRTTVARADLAARDELRI